MHPIGPAVGSASRKPDMTSYPQNTIPPTPRRQAAHALEVIRSAMGELRKAYRFNPADELKAAGDAVANVLNAGEAVTAAFRKLGEASGIAAAARVRDECEAAMLLLDKALREARRVSA